MFKISKEEVKINEKKIVLETGKIARQADGAIIATCGETVVIATAVGAKRLNEYLLENNLKPNLIFGMLNNKKAFEFLSILKNNIDILYPIKIPEEKNSLTENEIYSIAKKLGINSLLKKNLRSINHMLMKKYNKNILITGSLYLIGKVRKTYL